MKPFHEMTRREAVEHLRSLYHAQPKADWDALAVGNVILHKGYGWHIARVPPKRGFVMATNLATGEVEKLLRSRYATPDLLVTDEATLAVLRTPHQEEIRKAMAAGIGISPLVQYDYPELFTPYPESWDEKRRERRRTIGRGSTRCGRSTTAKTLPAGSSARSMAWLPKPRRTSPDGRHTVRSARQGRKSPSPRRSPVSSPAWATPSAS